MTAEQSPDPRTGPGPWDRRDWLIAAGLAAAAGVLFLVGLSISTLGVTESRWAEIVRQMLRSGDYFKPVFNGEPYSRSYFDKPLLSYWAILPASWLAGGVSEWTVRLPSALAGIGAVLAVFALGRRMFGRPTGVLAALLLLTSAMFIKWSRSASADILNLLAVWLALWLWAAGGRQGRARHLLAVYLLLAVGCFLKGPVAGALFAAAAGLASSMEVLLTWRAGAWGKQALVAALRSEFRWLVSPGAFLGIGLAAVVFAGLLLLPVALNGSWLSAELMWRENVTRFIHPFDHKDAPGYLYVYQGLGYFAPWSLLLLAALWDARKRLGDRFERTALCLAAGIFIFLTASGSRRNYYVLPLVPALALVTGRALACWLEAPDRGGWPARLALAATAIVAVAASPAAVAVGMKMGVLRPPAIGLLVAAGAVSALIAVVLWLSRTARARLAVLVALVWCAELIYFTAGARLNEKSSTLRPFMHRVAEELRGVPDNRLAAYGPSSARFFFYLNRGGIRLLKSAADLEDFRRREPQGYICAKLKHFLPGEHGGPSPLTGMEPLVTQESDSERSEEGRLVLLRFAK